MYKGKTVIAFVGKTCSGKSTIGKSFAMWKKFDTVSIDYIVHIWNHHARPDTSNLTPEKLRELEMKSFPYVKDTVLREIAEADSEIVVVDGIQAERLLGDIIDTLVILKTTDEKRQEYSNAKKWSREKFDMINKLQEGMYD